MLILTATAAHVPKYGHDASEYEDAFAVMPGESLRAAVADGATVAPFSGAWARLLTADYVAGHLDAHTLPERTAILANIWSEQVNAVPLPWYALANVAENGSHAALLGATIAPETGAYTVLCAGDCALFHLRPETTGGGYRLVAAVPFARSDDFGTSPVLVATKPATQGVPVAQHTGTVQPGDVLYLMSDALAAWFLREWEASRAPTEWLAAIDRSDAFTNAVRELRDTNRLQNDDVTVVRVTVGTA